MPSLMKGDLKLRFTCSIIYEVMASEMGWDGMGWKTAEEWDRIQSVVFVAN
jgi:hypothetical protein